MTNADRSISRLLMSLISVVPATTFAEQESLSKFSFQPYVSIRMQAESVTPDNEAALGDYRALRDAYTRVGFSAAYDFSQDYALFAQLEIPFDSVNFRFRDSYDQGGAGRDSAEDQRVARFGLRSPYGELVAGQQWMPYYNAITYPVDQFSSFYSGFATYTTFRVKETLAYRSPYVNGFRVSGSYSSAAGNARSPSRIDDRRIQAAVNYVYEDTALAIGMDDRGNAAGYQDRIYGASISQNLDAFNVSLKYELIDTDNPNSFFGDNSQAFTIFTSYVRGKNTYKALLANVEGYGEAVMHLGIDHQYSQNLRFFAEYYQEQETAAIVGKHEGTAGFNAAAGGGKLFTVGFRYDINM